MALSNPFLYNGTAPLIFKATSLTKQMWSLLLCLICIRFGAFKFSLPATSSDDAGELPCEE